MSNRWVDRFRHRHLLKQHKLHGESSSADQGGAMSFLQKVQSKLEKYHPKDIYNMDDTAVLTVLRLHLRFPEMHLLDWRLTKQEWQLHSLATRIPLIIGKSEKPRCFKGKDGTYISNCILVALSDKVKMICIARQHGFYMYFYNSYRMDDEGNLSQIPQEVRFGYTARRQEDATTFG